MSNLVSLPHTSLSVSRLCLGTNMFGTALDAQRSHALLDRFTSLGGNFIDTARMYGDWIPDAPIGASERTIGGWLKGRKRESVAVATKGGGLDLRAGDWKPRMTLGHIGSDLTQSLEHLQTNYIDLYWLHADDPTQPVQPIIDGLIAHQKAGHIRAFGASNWSPSRIAEAQAYARSLGHPGFVAIQPFWGLAEPNGEAARRQGYWPYYEDGFRAIHDAGMPVIPYSGQSRGVFTKWAQGGEDSLPEALKAIYVNGGNRQRLKVVQALAAKHNVTINRIVLAYLLSQPNLTIPIIGASRPEQLDDSFKALDVKLSSAELSELRSGN